MATTPTLKETKTETAEDLISQANIHYQKALDAQKRGDWATYGQEIEALGNVLNKLK